MDRTLQEVAREWLAARNVIVAFLREMRPDMKQEVLEDNAACLIARLAGHKPPIILEMYDKLAR